MKALSYLTLAAFAALLLYAAAEMPSRGELDTPVHREENLAGRPTAPAYFIQNAYRDAATPNVVTVILADYRSFDTLGEVVVVFAAGLACFLILRRRRRAADLR